MARCPFLLPGLFRWVRNTPEKSRRGAAGQGYEKKGCICTRELAGDPPRSTKSAFKPTWRGRSYLQRKRNYVMESFNNVLFAGVAPKCFPRHQIPVISRGWVRNHFCARRRPDLFGVFWGSRTGIHLLSSKLPYVLPHLRTRACCLCPRFAKRQGKWRAVGFLLSS